MERRRLEAIDEEAPKSRRRGWHLGSEQFKEQMLELMEGKLGESHSGELHRETAEQRPTASLRRSWRAGAGRSPSGPLAGAATPASWPSLPGCGAKRPGRSSGLRRR